MAVEPRPSLGSAGEIKGEPAEDLCFDLVALAREHQKLREAATSGDWAVAPWSDKTVVAKAWIDGDILGTDPSLRGEFMSCGASSADDVRLIAKTPEIVANEQVLADEVLRLQGELATAIGHEAEGDGWVEKAAEWWKATVAERDALKALVKRAIPSIEILRDTYSMSGTVLDATTGWLDEAKEATRAPS